MLPDAGHHSFPFIVSQKCLEPPRFCCFLVGISSLQVRRSPWDLLSVSDPPAAVMPKVQRYFQETLITLYLQPVQPL